MLFQLACKHKKRMNDRLLSGPNYWLANLHLLPSFLPTSDTNSVLLFCTGSFWWCSYYSLQVSNVVTKHSLFDLTCLLFYYALPRFIVMNRRFLSHVLFLRMLSGNAATHPQVKRNQDFVRIIRVLFMF